MGRVFRTVALLGVALVVGALTAGVVGARLLSDLSLAVAPEVGAGLGAVAGLVVAVGIPLYLASRVLGLLGERGHRPTVTLVTWILANALTLGLTLGAMRASSADALRSHGDWFLAGRQVPEVEVAVGWLADRLSPADGEADEVPAADEGPWTAKRVFAERSAAIAVVRTWSPVDRPEILELLASLGGREVEGQGSAFAVGPDLLVTNYHVIGKASRAEVSLPDGRILSPVEIVALDATNDLALIRLPGANLASIPLADAPVEIGDPCYAIGAPLGMDQTLTEGIVSALREIEGTRVVQMQTPIAPGSSGSPLLDGRGQVIGVNTATFGGGMNVAVDLSHVRALLAAPAEPRALGVPDARMEVVSLTAEGDLLPTARGQLGEVAGVMVRAIEDCLAPVPADADVRIDLSAGRFGLHFDGTSAEGEAERCLRERIEAASFLWMFLQGSLDGVRAVEVRFERRGGAPAAPGVADGSGPRSLTIRLGFGGASGER